MEWNGNEDRERRMKAKASLHRGSNLYKLFFNLLILYILFYAFISSNKISCQMNDETGGSVGYFFLST